MKKLMLLITFCLMIGANAFCAADEISWMTNVTKAMEQAQKENKPVLLHFYGDFCGPCRAMDKTVFPDSSVIKELNQNFIPVKIDTSRDPATTQKYGIRGIPADVFVSPQGEILHQRVGGASAQKYLQEIQNVTQIAHTKLQAMPVSTAVAQNDVGSQSVVKQQMNDHVDATFANEMVAKTAQTSQSSQWVEAASNQAMTNSRIVKMGGGLPLKTTTTVVRRPVADLVYENNISQSMPESGVVQANVPGTQSVPEQVTESTLEKQLLFDGFCPVTLSLETRWVKGQEQFFAEYEDGLFYFASEEAQNMFEEAPYQFAPVASGHDIVEWAFNQKKIAGSRKYGAWFQGNVYLFSNQDNYERFQANPHFFAGQALQLSRLFSHQLR